MIIQLKLTHQQHTMSKIIIGSLLIFFPLAISLVSMVGELEYFWYFDDDHQRYDLIHSVISFIIIMIGVYLVLDEHKKMFIYFLTMCFVFYQSLASVFSPPRYLALIELTPTSKVAMISYDYGALASTSHANLEIFETHYLFFMTSRTIKSFDNVSTATLSQSNSDAISVEFANYDREIFVEEVQINDIKKR